MAALRKVKLHALFVLLTLLVTLGCGSRIQLNTPQSRETAPQQQTFTTAWQETVRADSIDGYEKYLRQYPGSPMTGEARQRLEALYEQRDWKTAQSTDTLAIYEEFLRKYPQSRQAFQAKARLETLRSEAAPWKAAQEKNTIEAYQDFLNRYPNSPYAEKARGKIVDLEVTDIMRTKPGKLPPPQKVSSTPGRSYSVVNLHNDTKYTLTIRYSGPHSIKLKLAPGEKKEAQVQVGKYRVAASADATHVRSYAGEQTYEGADYNSRFYIITSGTAQIEPVKVYELPKVYKLEPTQKVYKIAPAAEKSPKQGDSK